MDYLIIGNGEIQQCVEDTTQPFFVPYDMARRLGYDRPFYLPPLEPPLEPEHSLDELHERISVLEEGLQPQHKPELAANQPKEKPQPKPAEGVKL